MAGLPIMLAVEALFDMALLNCRPSAVAAAILYAERRHRGAVPFWPTMLAKMTGYEDLTSPELAVAVHTAQKLCRKVLYTQIYKAQALSLAGGAAGAGAQPGAAPGGGCAPASPARGGGAAAGAPAASPPRPELPACPWGSGGDGGGGLFAGAALSAALAGPPLMLQPHASHGQPASGGGLLQLAPGSLSQALSLPPLPPLPPASAQQQQPLLHAGSGGLEPFGSGGLGLAGLAGAAFGQGPAPFAQQAPGAAAGAPAPAPGASQGGLFDSLSYSLASLGLGDAPGGGGGMAGHQLL
jgi:hypothetical protein